jgi:fatty-acyl-CoA synthase
VGLSSPVRSDEERVLDVVRELAREVGGNRAASAVTPAASLERDVGLGSLERVELLTRLEASFGRELTDRLLMLDTPREIAHALHETTAASTISRERESPVEPAAAAQLDDVVTLAEALRRRAAADPGRVHAILEGDGGATESLTYSALLEGAERIAAGLAARGIHRGDTVAIMLPTGAEFLQAFMGVLIAGGIAVPLYPPARLDRMAEYLERQARILANAEARVMIAMPEAAPVARVLRTLAPALSVIVTVDQVSERSRRGGEPVTIGADDAALIQYTSGSTGSPKGVLLTHAAILANIRAIGAGVELRPTDVAVSWLPLYHDMGLIGTWLSGLVQGFPVSLMSPLAFLARPERWLWALHRRRGSLSAAPNFAYELCVKKVRDESIEGLDLSAWRCALNGSEPVSPATLDRFAARFERYGFRREAFMPVYGLAESAVALSFSPVGRGPLVDHVARDSFTRERIAVPAASGEPSALAFVSVGRALQRHETRVVDAAGVEVPDRVVGRLIFRGPSSMAGYYKNPEATAASAVTDGWLDSGDLAYRTAGELFITGRSKDLIIVAGRNLVPQEIEEVAGAVEGIRKGCVAAFGVPDEDAGTEQLVVVAESRCRTDAERERLERMVVAGVIEAVGVPPSVVRIVPPGTVPKTPSGKIRRSAARDRYLHGGAALDTPLRLKAALVAGAMARAVGRLIGRVGRALYIAYLAVATALSAIVIIPLLWLAVRLVPEGRPARILSRLTAWKMLAITGCRVAVDGRARMPRTGPLVIVANHASYADALALLRALPIDFVFVAMRELLDWPVVGALARRGLHPTVDRWNPQQSVADSAAIVARLRAGAAVLFFPEGGYRAAAALRPFRLGAFEAAIAAGAPVVPVAIRGTRRALRAGAWIPTPTRIEVWIGDPIRAEGEGWQAALRLRDQAADAIAAHCGEPRLDRTPRSAERGSALASAHDGGIGGHPAEP